MHTQEFESGSQPTDKRLPLWSLQNAVLKLGLAGTMSLGAIATTATFAQADPLIHWNFNPATNNLEIAVKAGTTPRYFLMAQPARIVMDLPGTSIGAGVKRQEAYSGAVRQIRVSQSEKGVTRIVLELAPNTVLAPGQVQLQKASSEVAKSETVRWVLRPLLADAPSPVAVQNPAAVQTTLVSPASGAATTPPTTPRLGSVAATPDGVPVGAIDTSQGVAIAVPPPAPGLSSQPAPGTSAATVVVVPPPALVPSAPVAPSAPASVAVSSPGSTIQPASEMPATPQKAAPMTSQTPAVPPLSASSTKPVADAASEVPPPIATASTAVTPPVVVPPVSSPALVSPVAKTVPPPALSQPNGTSPIELPGSGSATVSSVQPASINVPPISAPAAVPTVVAAPPVVKASPAQAIAPAPVSVSVPPLPTPVSIPPAVSVPPAPSGATTSLPPISAAPMAQSEVPPTVTVPPLQQSQTSPSPSVTVPPLLPSSSPTSAPGIPSTFPSGAPSSAATSGVVNFGQPLPLSRSSALPNQVVVPAGATLSLRYPGATALSLRTGTPQQEVLLLQSDLRDAMGNVIAPQGTMVTGRFETNSAGSRFITQGISLSGRNIPLMAQSELLAGNRKMSDNDLVRNSGIGAIAGGLIGGFSGLGIVGGAATGAAVTYLTSPKPATIQPGQVLEVRLIEALR